MTLTAVDLFSGPGGMTVGLKNARFQVLGAIEADSIAVETYRTNHPEVAITHRGIQEIDPRNWIAELGLGPGELSLLAACPPCQGFSTVRTRNGKQPVDDARNDLVQEVLRFTMAVQPAAVLMENVPGLRSDARLTDLLDGLRMLGYDTGEGPLVLNAADYGVPQRRRRLVVLASQVGRIAAAGASTKSPRTVRDAIATLCPAGQSGDELHDIPERRSDKVMRIIRAVPKDGGSRRDVPEELRLACHAGFNGFKDVYGRMAWDMPAPTITGGCFNPSKGRFLHPEEDRSITLREAALLQDFPADYKFSLARGKQAAAAMIGNALPPRFVQVHAEMIANRVQGAAGGY